MTTTTTLSVPELLAHIAQHPDRLFVRLYVDLTGPKILFDAELLEMTPQIWPKTRRKSREWDDEEQEEGPKDEYYLVDAPVSGYLGERPRIGGGAWSDPAFTQEHLFPRLEAHPQWLTAEPIVTVAKLPDGTEEVVKPLGRLVVQYLLFISFFFREDGTTRWRLRGIIAEHNKQTPYKELLT